VLESKVTTEPNTGLLDEEYLSLNFVVIGISGISGNGSIFAPPDTR
jgi:hypothetical protein